MSDIFREVEEEVRREKLEKLWKRYGDYVIAAAAALIVGVAGFKLWQHYQAVQIEKASTGYMQAAELASGGKNAEAAAAFAKIAKSAPSGYAETAELARAGQVLAQGKKGEALALYKAIAAKHKDEIGNAARIRAAWIMADNAQSADIPEYLAPLNTEKSGWRHMAREILAYVDFRDGKLKEARAAFDKLAADSNTPGNIRQRAAEMASLMKTGVGDFGTVPEPEKPAEAEAGAETATTTGQQK